MARATALVLIALATGAWVEPPTYGITPPGPTYLRAHAASDTLHDQVRSLLGDRWGSSWFIPNPGRWEIGVVGDGPVDDVRALVDASEFADVVDLAPVPYSPQQEQDAFNQLDARLGPLTLQGKVMTGLGLDDAGLPSVLLSYANNATESDRRAISDAVAALAVTVAIRHVDRPDLFVIADRATPKKRASRPHRKRKHRAPMRKRRSRH